MEIDQAMTSKMDLEIRYLVKGVRIGLILEKTVVGHRFERGIFACGTKRPICIMLQQNECLSAFDIHGSRCDMADIAARFPDQCARFFEE